MLQQTMHMDAIIDTTIPTIGKASVPSPLHYGHGIAEDERVLLDTDSDRVCALVQQGITPTAFEKAGPREKIYFDPVNLRAAVMTCGGLCPGLNDVIRAIVHELYFMYGVRRIKGIPNGYAGLNPENRLQMIDLTPDAVRTIHEDGGTILGSSRGPQPVDVMVDTLIREEIRVLFCIGGDGTLRGANEIVKELKKRCEKIAVIGIPKTIDNDIQLVSRSFGFDTAVSAAMDSLRCAHTEARAHINGIGMVKLMGRYSGFVAANAALASADANFVLVPEVPFDLDGVNGLLRNLERRLRDRGHALVVVAEGAGQNLFDDLGTDASGNKKLGNIGLLLKGRIQEHFTGLGIEHTVKYIDPSYIIRSVPANPNDGIFCLFLGQHAVHAGMAGKTGMLISNWNNKFVHIPIRAATRRRKQVDPNGALWRSVLESTGMPEQMTHDGGAS